MSANSLPPFPSGGSWQTWAVQMVEYLQNRDQSHSENLSEPVFLSPLRGDERALSDGILMFNQTTSEVVVSSDNTWKTISASAQTTANFMSWRGEWVGGTHYEYDVVVDWPYTMVANKETTDRPAPQPLGAEEYIYSGSSPTGTITAKSLTVANTYTVADSVFMNGYRVYTVAGNEYSVYRKVNGGAVTSLASFTAPSSGWQEFDGDGVLYLVGDSVKLICNVSEPEPTPTTFVGDWNYVLPNNETSPLTGEITHSSKVVDELLVSTLDDAGSDRRTELLTMVNGDIIRGAGKNWSVVNIVDNTTYFTFSVAPATRGFPAGVSEFAFETVVATPISTVIDSGYYLADATVSPSYKIDSGTEVFTDDGYGLDLLVQRASVSDDWDVLAVSGKSTAATARGADINSVDSFIAGDRAVDFGIEIAEKSIFNTYGDVVSVLERGQTLHKFGKNLDLGTSQETVWAQGGEEVYATTNSIDTISSSDAGDTQTITVQGHTVVGTGAASVFTYVSQTATLNGQSKVALTTPLARVQRFVDTGSSEFAGDVYVYDDTAILAGVPTTSAPIHLKVLAGTSQSNKTAFTVAGDEYFIGTSLTVSVNKKTTSVVDFSFERRSPGQVFRPSNPVSLNSAGLSAINISLYPYVIVPKNSDVRVAATASVSGVEVSAAINGFYADIIA